MMTFQAINGLSARWLDWVAGGLVDGCLALLVMALVWLAFGRRLEPRLGAWLFALVLLKCLVPFPVMVPAIHQVIPEPLGAFLMDEESPRQVHEAAPASPSLAAAAPALPAESGDPLSTASWLLLAWLTGMMMAAARLLWLWRRTQSLIGKARRVEAGEVEELPPLLRQLEGRSSLMVCITGELSSPAVAGCWRPVLLLPEGLHSRLSPEQQRWVLAHELAHIRAGDIAWQWVEALVRSLLFFHPAVWLASAQSARLRERACDEEAVRVSGTSRQSSAAGFVSLIEWAQKPVPLAGLSLGSAGREARARIRALAGAPLRLAAWRWQAGAGLLCAAVIMPSFRAGQAQQVAARDPRIAELEKRVADLELQLQQKSRLETLRENAVRRAHQRVEQDVAAFTPEQRIEMERIYQDAKSVAAPDQRSRAFAPLFSRYPGANRTGCALLLLANLLQPGAEREALLLKAVREHSGAYFLDGTSVGGVARLMLARDAQAAGRAADADQWRRQIRQGYADELDFGAVPLGDILDAPAPARP